MYQMFAGFKMYRKLCKVYRVLMEFIVFKDGKEVKVIVTLGEIATANTERASPTACRIDALSQMQNRYLTNKKRQQMIKNREAKCFEIIAKELPLTRDVIGLICKYIRERPFDPKDKETKIEKVDRKW